MPRIKLRLLPEGYGLEYAQAVLEREMEAAVRFSGRPAGVLANIDEPVNVVGFYSPWIPGNTYRRITGGPPIASRDGIIYLGVAQTYPGTLESLLLDSSRLGVCLGGEVAGGRVTGGELNGVLGVTKLGHLGLYELAIKGASQEELVKCVKSIYGDATLKTADVEGVKGLAGTYRSISWTRYPGADLPVRVTVKSERGFYASLSVSMQGPYIAEARIEGDFYAAPPVEPYNIVVRLEGTQVNELVFYQIKLSWRNRAELAGIDYTDVDRLFDELYSKLEAAEES